MAKKNTTGTDHGTYLNKRAFNKGYNNWKEWKEDDLASFNKEVAKLATRDKAKTKQLPAKRKSARSHKTDKGEGWAGVLNSLIQDPTLSDGQFRLFCLVLSYDWKSKGEGCTAKQETLAAHMNCSKRTIRRLQSELEERGMIELEQRSRQTNVIRVVDRFRYQKNPRPRGH